MDNQKKGPDRIQLDQSTKIRKWFRREPDLENVARKQEPAGSGTAALNRRTGPEWGRFHGDK